MVPVKVEILEKETVKIYRMATLDPQGKPFMWVSAFLIDGLLIDFGHPHAKDDFLRVLDLDEIEMCVLTHQHEDHWGACYDIINKYKIPIYANKATAFLVRFNLRLPRERIMVWGFPKPCVLQVLPNIEEIKTSRAKFKIIPTPGHCKTLISLYHERKRLLFSTDAFIDPKQTVIFNWENANIMLETLEKLNSLNPKYYFQEDGSLATPKDISDLIQFWNEIKIKSWSLHNQGVKLREIVKRIFGGESYLNKLTRGAMSRENLIRSLLDLPPITDEKLKTKSIKEFY
jgi:ribonuclease/clavin/mitogillin